MAGEDAVAKLKAKSVEPGKYDLVLHPSHLWLTIHESVGHPTELDRSLWWEANYAGTSFLTPRQDRANFSLDRSIVNFFADRTQKRRARHRRLTTMKACRVSEWHLVKDGVFVDWQTTRDLAPLVGRQKILRLPARGQLGQRSVSAHAERFARAGTGNATHGRSCRGR